jgi:hypothetical protein
MFDFIIAGNQKCATTSLYDYLLQCPNVVLPEIKEVPYFSNNDLYSKESEWEFYFGGEYRSRNGIKGFAYVNLGYFSEVAIPRVKEISPNAKYIFLLRDPFERAVSAFEYARARGWEGCVDFKSAFDMERNFQAYAEMANLTYIEHSLYAKQLSKIIQFVNVENILLLNFDELAESPDVVVSKVLEFIGASDCNSEKLNFGISNKGFVPKLPYLQSLIMTDNKIKKAYQYLSPKKIRSFLNKKVVRKVEGWNHKSVDRDYSEVLEFLKANYSEVIEMDKHLLKDLFPDFEARWLL